jgi:pimeloyl-ACP methyl ester carboxylesterase
MKLQVDGRTVNTATGAVSIERDEVTDAPLVVLLHGAGMDRTVWSQQTRWLAHHGTRALAVDLPGHGDSEGPAITSIWGLATWTARLAEALGGRIHLVGHSMGAFIALEAAAATPDRIASVVLMGVGAAMPVHPDLQVAADDDDPLAAALMAGWMHGPDQKFGLNPTPGMSMTGTSRAVIEACPPGVLGSDLAACATYPGAVDAATALTCPVTLILGSLDRMTPRRAAQPLLDAMPSAAVVELPDSGHAPMMEEPGAVRRALGDHLGRLAV